MKANYKVGDKVKIREDLDANRKYEMYVNPYMERLHGKTLHIASVIDGITFNAYTLAEDARGYYWTEDMFEPKKHQPIIIYQKDASTVVALDKETHKKGEAVCSKDDKFDFMVGAKLAFERLEDELGEDKEPITAKEKREWLNKFCNHKHCDKCVLGGETCRCGLGTHFRNKNYQHEYEMTDAEINLAYALAKLSEEK